MSYSNNTCNNKHLANRNGRLKAVYISRVGKNYIIGAKIKIIIV